MEDHALISLHDQATASADGAVIDVRDRELSLVFLAAGGPEGMLHFEGSVNGTDYDYQAMRAVDGSYASTAVQTPGDQVFHLARRHGLSTFRARLERTSGAFTVLCAKRIAGGGR